MAENLLNDVLNALPSAVAVIDPATDRLVWHNQRFADLAAESGLALQQFSLVGERPGWSRIETPLPAEGGGLRTLIELRPLGAAAPAARVQKDPVTCVLSRAALECRIEEWFVACADRPFALVFVDLDGFKRVNDVHGHLVGDLCLREVGRRLQSTLRAGDIVGRYGGDEFVILLAAVSDEPTYRPVAERLRAAVESPETLVDETPELPRGGDIELGVSLGVAFCAGGYADVRSMIAEADRAMYADKRSRLAQSEGPPASR